MKYQLATSGKSKVEKAKRTNPELPAKRREIDRLENWHLMASLVVYRGLSVSAAYRAVYDEPEAAQCPAHISGSPNFKRILTRLRASQGMSEEQVKGAIEGLYLECVHDEERPMKERLQAAAQWQRMRGLEKPKPEVKEDDLEEFFAATMRACRKAQERKRAEAENVLDLPAESVTIKPANNCMI
jgi:hypothetical protein